MTDAPPPPAFNTGYAFVALMAVTGISLALIFRAVPGVGDATTGLIALLGVSLVFDVAINRYAGDGKAAALTTPWRIGGFVSGALLHIGLLAAG